MRSFVLRNPLKVFFGLAYLLSILALSVIGIPDLPGKTPVPPSSFVMFPVLVVGVGTAGLALAALTKGMDGVRQIARRMRTWRVGRRALALLIPPIGITAVLFAFKVVVSPAFAENLAPNFIALGLGIGLVSGFFEELGWTGFAYPRMTARYGPLGGALWLGALWGVWHLPVVDSLGAASPHGGYLPAFFAAFVAAMVAMRVLIAWLYTRTGSLLRAQLLHASSTASLVALGAPHVSAGQEALWYAAYGGLLWTIAAVVVGRTTDPHAGRRGDSARSTARTRAAGSSPAAL